MGEAISHASRSNDTRREWKLMRILGGTGRRERKKCSKDIKREDPSPDEWIAAMEKVGREGGCEARLVKKLGRGEAYDRREVISCSAEGDLPETGSRVCRPSELLAEFEGMKYMRCVPEGRARKELYQML